MSRKIEAVLTSTDGVTWTMTTTAREPWSQEVTWDGTQFVTGKGRWTEAGRVTWWGWLAGWATALWRLWDPRRGHLLVKVARDHRRKIAEAARRRRLDAAEGVKLQRDFEGL